MWSVDFCGVDTSLLVSGSDDGRAKVWCTRDRNSVLELDVRANVCCVKARAEVRACGMTPSR